MVVKEAEIVVEKVWGKEVWIVNNDYYCGKFLHINKGAECSYHYHPVKIETFKAIEGQVGLVIDGKGYMLNPFSRPKTIQPGTLHCFRGLTDAILLEISSHHEDGDVVRVAEGINGVAGKAQI